MPKLPEELRIQASTILRGVAEAHDEAKRQCVSAERNIHQRQMRQARRDLMNAASAISAASTGLEELRKVIDLDEPKTSLKKELIERAGKAVKELEAAKIRLKTMEDTGEKDPNILAAIQGVVTRYQTGVTECMNSMLSNGFTPQEVEQYIPLPK